MKLFEAEGKQLLKRYGVMVPQGWLKDDVPSDVNFPVVAKTQVLTGGRGKTGGIQVISDKRAMDRNISSLMQKNIKGEKVRDIYIEETVKYKREIYLSIMMDRTKRSPLIIASASGGVDIEETPQENIILVPVNSLLGLETYITKKIAIFLDVDLNKMEYLLNRLYELFIDEKAELVEINPLFVDVEDNLVAGDAKVVLSENDTRKSEHLLFTRNTEGFEERCKALKAGGVEIGGDVAIVASGAGLGMATLDIVSYFGGTANSLIDLQGHVIHDLNGAKRLIQEIKKTSPKSFLFNFYFQVASCKVLAEAIKSELGNGDVPVVVRMKGVDQEEAGNDLKLFPNIFITDNLKEACETALLYTKEVQ
ncbi:ATP-grasp domain-containing protein [Lentibacillus sp. CBA3610]|uniref:ATP-grasp domain-containing protein n=1 Tax=Lentibacillus sp. CBA3610 TaxID=2518176 RepID=UPI0015961369|nr:ATP-grasp domain-containing protein [Lentibacillus sp. CBA3610]QKY70272.1 hypothetical protein Len3610_12300 [Lentibacillus sp. CBA3610]